MTSSGGVVHALPEEGEGPLLHIFRLDVAVAAMLSESRADGHMLEIDCRTQQGEDCRLRLEFTTEGLILFSEIMTKLVESHRDALGEEELSAAAEPTTVAGHEAQHRQIERYFVAHLSTSELRRLADELRPYGVSGANAHNYAGHDRVVLWRVPDPRIQGSDGGGYRVYLSAGSLLAAAQTQVPVEVVGEISRLELPEGRELLIGDPPVDWQDTTVPSASVTLQKLAPSMETHAHLLQNQTGGSMNDDSAQPVAGPDAAAIHPAEGHDRDVELRRFVAEHPNGWEHADWLELLQRLRQHGQDTGDADGLGRALERQRLMILLGHVPGIGLKRMQAITDRYPNVWTLRQAGIDGLAASVNIPASLAERIQEVV
jgi:hypothetical protein